MQQRKTSADALAAVMATTELGPAQKKAYKTLYEHGPLTGMELNKYGENNGLHKRLCELRDSGVIDEVGIRLCSVTGYRAYMWDVNSNLPSQRVHYKQEYEKAIAVIADLEQQIIALKQQISDGIPTEPGGQTRLL